MSNEHEILTSASLAEAHRSKREERIAAGEVAIRGLKPDGGFNGYPTGRFRGGLSFYATFTPESLEVINAQVLGPVQEAAKKFGISCVVAGKGDMEPHLTLGNFTLKGDQTPETIAPELEQIQALMDQEPPVMPIHINDFVPGGACTLGVRPDSVNPDPFTSIFLGRTHVQNVLSELLGGKLNAFDPYLAILHITTHRLLSQSGTGEFQPEGFIHFSRSLREDLWQDPLELNLDSIHFKPTLQAIQELSPKGVILLK